MKLHAAPVGSPRMWTLPFGQHEDRTPTHRLARLVPEGLPAAATVAYLCPHHACPSAYPPGRVHRAVPPHQGESGHRRPRNIDSDVLHHLETLFVRNPVEIALPFL